MTIFERLNFIFRAVFDDDTLQIDVDMTANDIDGWDSLSHVNLIVAVETEFSIRFKQREVHSFKNIGDLNRCIESKLTS